MRKLLRKILEILDGTPAVYGKKNQGQSVVELALVTPILIVLLMGLAEIGWFANNYLILMEVTRVGARFGTTQTGETAPQAWNNGANRLPQVGNPSMGGTFDFYRDCNVIRSAENRQYRGFYNLIACIMLQSMDPLTFDPDNEEDDIIISAFSLQAINPAELPAAPFVGVGQTPRQLITNALIPGYPTDTTQVIIVGRYPTTANECLVGPAGQKPFRWEDRDPFDFFVNNRRDYRLKDAPLGDPADGSNRRYMELEGYDPDSYPPYTADPMPGAEYEYVRGWTLTGQHEIDGTNGNCYGSEWTMDEVEALMNVANFELRNTTGTGTVGERVARIPSQGLVMVEMYWQHELLLKNPVFNPVWSILGDQTTVNVWAAFPLPSTEPRLTFN